jgi:hypothetical protein
MKIFAPLNALDEEECNFSGLHTICCIITDVIYVKIEIVPFLGYSTTLSEQHI